VRGRAAATLDAAEPWGLTLDAVPGAAFRAVTDGLAWLRIPGRALSGPSDKGRRPPVVAVWPD